MCEREKEEESETGSKVMGKVVKFASSIYIKMTLLARLEVSRFYARSAFASYLPFSGVAGGLGDFGDFCKGNLSCPAHPSFSPTLRT